MRRQGPEPQNPRIKRVILAAAGGLRDCAPSSHQDIKPRSVNLCRYRPFQGYLLFATLPTLGALPEQLCVTHASRVAKEERRFRTGYYEFVISHTDNDRRAVLAAPGYDVLAERQADGGLLRGRRGVAIVRHS